MKKQYTKPEVVFEDFSLSTSIAGNCDRIIGNHAAGQCGLVWGRKTIFLQRVTGCTTKVVDGSPDYDFLCYHVPYSTSELFNS